MGGRKFLAICSMKTRRRHGRYGMELSGFRTRPIFATIFKNLF